MSEVWYALVQQEQLGPMDFEEVLDFYYKDIISASTLLWREGMPNWVPITHISDFAELLFQGTYVPQQVEVLTPSLEESSAVTDRNESDDEDLEDISVDETNLFDGDVFYFDDDEPPSTPPTNEHAPQLPTPKLPSTHTPSSMLAINQIGESQDLNDFLKPVPNGSTPSSFTSSNPITIQVEPSSKLPLILGLFLFVGGAVFAFLDPLNLFNDSGPNQISPAKVTLSAQQKKSLFKPHLASLTACVNQDQSPNIGSSVQLSFTSGTQNQVLLAKSTPSISPKVQKCIQEIQSQITAPFAQKAWTHSVAIQVQPKSQPKSLSSKDFKQKLAEKKTQVLKCLEVEKLSTSSLHLSLKVKSTGKVDQITLDPALPKLTESSHCFSQIINQIEFPPFQGPHFQGQFTFELGQPFDRSSVPSYIQKNQDQLQSCLKGEKTLKKGTQVEGMITFESKGSFKELKWTTSLKPKTQTCLTQALQGITVLAFNQPQATTALVFTRTSSISTKKYSKTQSSSKAKRRVKTKGSSSKKLRATKTKPKAKQGTSTPSKKGSSSKSKTKKTMLAQADILPVVKKQQKRFLQCAEADPELKGKFVQVRIQIEKNGKVTSARPITRALRKSPQKQCVIQIIKGLKFPAFTGDPQTVPIPIRF